jgi:hypothetical protein
MLWQRRERLVACNASGIEELAADADLRSCRK